MSASPSTPDATSLAGREIDLLREIERLDKVAADKTLKNQYRVEAHREADKLRVEAGARAFWGEQFAAHWDEADEKQKNVTRGWSKSVLRGAGVIS